ncbi:hypothetical protein [Streptomyces mexicanus]|uniref:Uncharacterized protein n=1 Tax=Streptomyces mexicanus TaxID=178566 RepID=A0A7X1I287_9ACTN|nr:hypothetical protein [Streptomyces mexicanus]MBC2867450.1 hypothetical protein [Streptomyces mexicanus]
MLDTDVYGDATAEEIRALGYDPDDSWGRPSPWEFGNQLTDYRQKIARAQQEDAEPAEEGPVRPSPEELKEILAEVYGSEAEREATAEETAIGRNRLVLINDPDWVDMTDRNWDYVAVVLSQSKDVLSPVDKNVLTVVAMHCGVNSRGCTASNETLAAELGGMDIRNFKAKMKDLTQKEWIREAGSLPPVPGKRSGTKVRHIGVSKARLQGEV